MLSVEACTPVVRGTNVEPTLSSDGIIGLKNVHPCQSGCNEGFRYIGHSEKQRGALTNGHEEQLQ